MNNPIPFGGIGMDTGRGVQPPLMYLPRPKKKQGYAEYPENFTCALDVTQDITVDISFETLCVGDFGVASFTGLNGSWVVNSIPLLGADKGDWYRGNLTLGPHNNGPIGTYVSLADGLTYDIALFVTCDGSSGALRGLSILAYGEDSFGNPQGIAFSNAIGAIRDIPFGNNTECANVSPRYACMGGVHLITQ